MVLAVLPQSGDRFSAPHPALLTVQSMRRMLVFLLLLTACAKTPAPSPTSYELGATGPAGGVVVYVASTPFPCGVDQTVRCTYLEVASKSGEASRTWVSPTHAATAIAGADDTALGAGASNTAAIVALDPDEGRSAAAYTAAYEQGGFDDWFLPSKDELAQLYAARLFLDLEPDFYWSSTEIEPVGAWSQYFLAGAQFNLDTRDAILWVRPIRAF